MWETKEEELAERRRKAEERQEDQRRRKALHAQMHPVLPETAQEDTKESQPSLSAKARRRMQASVETDTEDNSLDTDKAQRRPCNDSHKDARQKHDDQSPVSHANSEKIDPPLCLEKREGVYSCAPPAEFAREEVVTSTLHLRAPEPASTGSRAPRRNRRKCIAVWSGDEVRMIPDEISPMCLSHDQRSHRCAY